MNRTQSTILTALLLFLLLWPVHTGFGQGGNVLLNGSFESGTTSWSFYTNGAGNFSSVTPGYDGSRAARISITTAGTNVQFYQLNVPLDPNTPYRLSFAAYSNTGRDFSVSIFQNVSPYTNYGLNGVVANLTTGWQTFTMEFTTTGFSAPLTDARLRFWMAPYDVAGDIYYLDNIILEKAGVPPTVTAQPAPQSVYEGQTATFSVGVTGTAPLSYQWQRNLVDIPDATGPAYTTPVAALSDNGAAFRCVITNGFGSAASVAAVLTVMSMTDPPTITQQPVDRSIYTGQTATFSVAATGPPPISFQWQKNAVNISGAQSPSYTTPAAVRADSGSLFRCVVTNANGSVSSNAAMLRVDTLIGELPSITQHPANRTVEAGQTATFTVSAAGTPPLAYSWQKNGITISGATGSSYTTPATVSGDNGAAYRCVVTNAFGTVTSNSGVLTVLAPPPPASLRSPQPGDVYKEFSRIMTGDKDWRVTDPNATNSGSNAYKPNPVLTLNIADTVGAVRAELLIDQWGGHIGTTNKRVRFNGNSWITVPELGAGNGIPAGKTGQCYAQQLNPVVQIPLNHLRQGSNTLEGTSGAQSCFSYNWGQWGWYGVIVRVYYGPSKGGPRGTITTPSENGLFGDDPVIAADIQSSVSISRVEFFASYEGFDPDGDGVYGGYQHSYHRLPGESEMRTKLHVGTATAFPFQVAWNTSMVPDQPAGTVSILARVRDINGLWYVTPEVRGLTLQRDSVSVRMYKPQNVLENWRVRSGRTTISSTFTIPATDSIRWALSANLVVRTWNGTDAGSTAPEYHYLGVNSWTAPNSAYGLDNFYSLDILDVPPSALRSGSNTVTFFSNTVRHGIDVLWPGPVMLVRYSTVPPTPVLITMQPQNQVVPEGRTATFSVTATGTPPLTYQWQRNGVNIAGATGSSYTTPPVLFAETGSTYRCVVSNMAGSATSAAAVLTVTAAPITILQQPLTQTVKTGRSAAFSVSVAGSEPFSFQWHKNGAPISGATTAWYVTPATVSGDNGSTYACVVTNPVGSVTSNAAVLSLTSSTPPSLIRSDDFNALALDPCWVFINPGVPSTPSMTGTGTSDARVQVDIPGGEPHDFTASGALAPRLMQATNNTDFEIELKFESVMGGAIQRQGVIVEQDARNYMIFDFDWRGTYLRVRANKVVNNVFTSQYGFSITSGPVLYLKLKRATNTWSHSTSLNGTTWKLQGYFTHTLVVGRVGAWFGTAGSPAPAFTGKLDYFFNTASRISPEDGAALPPVITVQPASQTVPKGLPATFSITVVGTPPLLYQWKRNGEDIPGAAAPSYTTEPLAYADSGATFSCAVSNAFGNAISESATLSVIPDPSGIRSDDFNAFGIDTGIWTVINPLGDAQILPTGTNSPDAHLSVAVPGGVAHDAWTSGNSTVRLVQPTNNTDFWVEAKFESPMTAQYQIQGIQVHQDSINYIRFDFLRSTSGTSAYAASFLGGVPTARISVPITIGAPLYMRVRRTGDLWTQSFSPDGAAWTQAGAFTHAMNARTIGPAFGNAGTPPPAFNGLLDYFFLVNEPIIPEDGGVAVDTFPPVLSNIQILSRVDGFVASWTTNEPAMAEVAYGLTNDFELGAVVSTDLRTSHTLVVHGLDPTTTYRLRLKATDAAGNADSTGPITVATVTPTPPLINVWYGRTQRFGHLGNPTPAINILGDVADANGIMQLSYSLDGAPAVSLSIGPDTQRLNKAGDWNADIPTSALLPGLNQIVITAIDSQATAARETVMVDYTPGIKWARAYGVDWAQAGSIENVVQVVDGKWAITGDKIRTVETGYDRLLAIGERDWVNYEATMQVIVHALDPTGFEAPSYRPGIGFLMRWPGHSDLPVANAGRQPKTGYLPLGGLGLHRWASTGVQDISILGDNLRVVARDDVNRNLALNTRYWIKMRVESVPGLGSDYSMKIWPDGTLEPAAWDISGREPLSAPQAGCLLVVAHEVDVSIGALSVVPLDAPSTIVSDDFNTGALNTALWRFVDPRNDASVQIQGAGTGDPKVAITVPAGIKHEPWTPFNTTPRILQSANNTNFSLQAKFDSPLTQNIQIHGIIVEQDSVNFIRFDFSTDSSRTRIFSGTAAGGSFVGRYNQSITTGTPPYMRVRRLGAQWTLFYSYDAVNWVQTANFSHTINVSSVGLYGGNAGTLLPAYTMVADYFFNEEYPIVPEDGSPGGLAARVLQDPNPLTVASGDSAAFTVTVNGTPPLALRWQRDGVDIPGATTATLRFGPATVADHNGTRYRCIVSNAAGSDTSAAAMLTVAYPPSTIISDDFRNGTLNTSIWRYLNPKNDVTLSLTGAGTQDARLSFAIPGGVSHHVSTVPNEAPRILQAVNNTNFEVEAKFESGVSAVHQFQGILVQQNLTNFIRFDFVTNSALTATRVYAASYVNGTSTTRIDVSPLAIGVQPLWLRVKREGNLWTLRYSTNGSSFSTAGSFTHALTVDSVGVFAGNTGTTPPAFTAIVDYFFNLAATPGEEDPVVPSVVTPPAPATVTAGRRAVFTVVAAGSPPLSYQWQKNGLSIPGATVATYISQPVAPEDNGAQIRCIVSNPQGSVASAPATLTVNPAIVLPWWNNSWSFRLPVIVSPNSYERFQKPVELSVNFTSALAALGASGRALDTASLRVIEVDSTHAILDTLVPMQFDRDADFHSVTKASGTLVFLMKGNTPATTPRYFDVYFDTVGRGPFLPPTFAPQVQVTDTATYQGQESFKILSSSGTYFYHKRGGGFASFIDPTGADWISYSPATGASGQYRGIPNTGDAFHPGYTNVTSTLISQGPLKARIRSATAGNGWESYWDIFPGYARMTMTRMNGTYWWLYEGTPGGSFQTTDYYTRPNGVRVAFGTRTQGDLSGQEWAFFGDPATSRILFAAHHEDDTKPEYFNNLDGAMSIFGFGRQDPCCNRYLDVVPQTFTFGFGEDSTFTAARRTIYSAYKDLTVTTEEPQYRGTTGIPLLSNIVSDNFNSPGLNSDLWTYINPLGDAPVSMTGTQLRIAVPAGPAHDVWTSGINAPRIMQPAANTNFEVEVKFQSVIGTHYQIQGILVQQDPGTVLRFDFVRGTGGLSAFAARVAGGVATNYIGVSVPAVSPIFLRVRRVLNSWTHSYSTDGVTWTVAGTFTDDLTVNSIGVFFGNAGSPAPVFTGLADYFLNTDAPVAPTKAHGPDSATAAETILPTEYSLSQNYPNPFNPSTTIRYALPEPSAVTLRLYNMLGQEIATLVEAEQPAGFYSVPWRGSNADGGTVASGVYIYRMTATGSSGNTYTQLRKMILVR